MDIPTVKINFRKDEERMHFLVFFAFISLIPLLSVFAVASFTMINPRYQHNHSFLVTFIVTVLLYLIGSSLQRSGNIVMLLVVSIGLFILGRYF